MLILLSIGNADMEAELLNAISAYMPDDNFPDADLAYEDTLTKKTAAALAALRKIVRDRIDQGYYDAPMNYRFSPALSPDEEAKAKLAIVSYFKAKKYDITAEACSMQDVYGHRTNFHITISWVSKEEENQ